MPLTVKIITPERSFEPKEYDSVTLPAFDGEVGILSGHAPFVCQLGSGTLKLKSTTEADQELVLAGGVAQVADDEVRILAESVVQAEEIDEQALVDELKRMDAATYEDSVALAEARAKAFWMATQLRAQGKAVPELKQLG